MGWSGVRRCWGRRAPWATGSSSQAPTPALVSRRARARRCRKVPGRTSDGWRLAKRETFVGWRVHPVRRLHQVLTRVPMRPAGMHDLRLARPPGRGGWTRPPPRARLMQRAPWRRRGRRSSCDQGQPCVRTPGGWTPSQCVRITIRWRRSTVTWRRWAVSDCLEAPMLDLNGRRRETRLWHSSDEHERAIKVLCYSQPSPISAPGRSPREG